MPQGPAQPVQQHRLPSGRRSFSSIRSTIIPTSLSLPQLGLQPRLPPAPIVSRGKNLLSGEDQPCMPPSERSIQNGSVNTNTLPSNIRSLRSRFSFGSSSSAPRAVSAGSSLKAKFSLSGSWSGKPKTIDSPLSVHNGESPPESEAVLMIDGSSFRTPSRPASPEEEDRNIGIQTSGIYPPQLGRGLPRSSTLPTLSVFDPPSTPPERLVFSGQQAKGAASHNGRSITSMASSISPIAFHHRSPHSLGMDHSRISERTEPDTSMELSKASNNFRDLLKSPVLAVENAHAPPTDTSDLSSEGQVSKELISRAGSTESLTNLNIPAIPKSGSMLSLDQRIVDPSLHTETVEASEISVGSEDGTSNTHQWTSSTDAQIDADLAALLSPHRFEAKHIEGLVALEGKRLPSLSSRGSLTVVLSSTPAKRDASRRTSRSSANDLKLRSHTSPPASPSVGDSLLRSVGTVLPESTEFGELRPRAGSPAPKPRLPAASGRPEASPSSPSPSPTFYRRRPSSSKTSGLLNGGPSLPRSLASNDKFPSTEVPHLPKDPPPRPLASPFTPGSETLDLPKATDFPDLQRDGSRLYPHSTGRSESPVFPRSYSSLSAAARVPPRRGTVEELFRSSSPNSPLGGPVLRPRRSHSVDLHRPFTHGDASKTPASEDAVSRSNSRMRMNISPDNLDGWYGSRPSRLYQGAGLFEKGRDFESPSPPDVVRRPHTSLAWSPADVRSSSSLSGGWRRDRGLIRGDGNDGVYGNGYLHGSDTAAPESVSGFTSSSGRYSLDHAGHVRRASSSATNPASPVSSSRTLFSSSANTNPSTVQALRERHELETDALLTALGEAKRQMREAQDENVQLRTENHNLRAYVGDLERRISIIERRSKLANYEDISRTRVTPRPTPIPSNQGEPFTSTYRPREYLSSKVRLSRLVQSNDEGKQFDSAKLLSPRSRHVLNHGANVTPDQPRSRHRSARSDISSILPQMSGTMSMLMNEKKPTIEAFVGSSGDEFSNEHDDGVDDDDDDEDNDIDVGEFGSLTAVFNSSMRRSRRDVNGHAVGGSFVATISPTESSFAHTSPPGSPGSLMLRTEDEIHLNDLISLRDDSEG